MTTFNNFTLTIENSWAKKVVKSILQDWNVNDVMVYIWFTYLLSDKKSKNMRC